jgi:hypothetical protein
MSVLARMVARRTPCAVAKAVRGCPSDDGELNQNDTVHMGVRVKPAGPNEMEEKAEEK